MAAYKDIEFFRNEDVSLLVTVLGANDITGWTIRMTVRPDANSADPPTLTKTTGAGITITSPTTFEVSIAASDFSSASPGTYVYEIKRMDAGNKSVLVAGSLTLLEDVTRS